MLCAPVRQGHREWVRMNKIVLVVFTKYITPKETWKSKVTWWDKWTVLLCFYYFLLRLGRQCHSQLVMCPLDFWCSWLFSILRWVPPHPTPLFCWGGLAFYCRYSFHGTQTYLVTCKKFKAYQTLQSCKKTLHTKVCINVFRRSMQTGMCHLCHHTIGLMGLNFLVGR